jgi:hypothetical protein
MALSGRAGRRLPRQLSGVRQPPSSRFARRPVLVLEVGPVEIARCVRSRALLSMAVDYSDTGHGRVGVVSAFGEYVFVCHPIPKLAPANPGPFSCSRNSNETGRRVPAVCRAVPKAGRKAHQSGRQARRRINGGGVGKVASEREAALNKGKPLEPAYAPQFGGLFHF